MGSTKVRQVLSEQRHWTDKTAPKHKHDYCIECNLEVLSPYGVHYYHVIKCNQCNSFNSIPKERNNIGLIKQPIAGLPTLKAITHRKTLEFRDLVIGGVSDVNG